MKTKINSMKHFFFLISASICLIACDNENPVQPPPDPQDQGVFILNQGNPGANDAGLSLFDPSASTMQTDIFNGKLGDLAQDMILYGSKLYISVGGSNSISILDIRTLKEIKRIDMNIDEHSFSPWHFATHRGKVYVTTQESQSRDGYVFRIDTLSLAIEDRTQVGINPVGIAYDNNKLYVANSGLWGNPGNTLSVVDIASFKEIEKIEVGLNPNFVKSNGTGKIYLTYQGNFGNIPGGFQIIDTYSKEANIEVDINDRPFGNFALSGNTVYFYGVYYDEDYQSHHNGIFQYDIRTGKIDENPFIAASEIAETPFSIEIHPVSKEIYIASYLPKERGKMYIFDTTGNLKTKESVGLFPCKFQFY
ncbi:MAG: YncE family protein [Dysgonamonadaceae bacterium]|jgi:YVTN family beta-propeller protein|nr:YncE family protein [Dysgonamonadaceae bacterium]